MPQIFDPLAARELQEAVEYYNDQSPGLGDQFKAEVKAALHIIEQFPEIGSEERQGIHRFIIKRFPYKVIFSSFEEITYIIAIANNHREPNFWVDRV